MLLATWVMKFSQPRLIKEGSTDNFAKICSRREVVVFRDVVGFHLGFGVRLLNPKVVDDSDTPLRSRETLLAGIPRSDEVRVVLPHRLGEFGAACSDEILQVDSSFAAIIRYRDAHAFETFDAVPWDRIVHQAMMR